MASTYKVEYVEGDVLRVGFGVDSENDQKVRDAKALLDELVTSGKITGGEVIRINGPASLPVAMVLAHGLGHLFHAVACFDPKMSKYVVSIAHGEDYKVGDLLD